MKIQKLCEMQQEAEALEKQLDRQTSELSDAQGELDQLQNFLHTLKPEELRHVSKIAASDAVIYNSNINTSIVFFLICRNLLCSYVAEVTASKLFLMNWLFECQKISLPATLTITALLNVALVPFQQQG